MFKGGGRGVRPVEGFAMSVDQPRRLGLILNPSPLSNFTRGLKTWELRSSNTKVRGRIGIMSSGVKELLGEAVLVDSFPLTRELYEAILANDPKIFPWKPKDGTLTEKKKHGWQVWNVHKTRMGLRLQIWNVDGTRIPKHRPFLIHSKVPLESI